QRPSTRRSVIVANPIRVEFPAVPALRVNIVGMLVLFVSLAVGWGLMVLIDNPVPLVIMAVVGVIGMQAPRVAQQWERAIVLRLGKFVGLQGPGLFWIVPF